MPPTRPEPVDSALALDVASGSGSRERSTRLGVAALIDSAILSGPGRQLTALARAIRAHGVDIVVILFRRAGRAPSPLVRHLEEAGVEYVELTDSGPLDLSLASRVASVLRTRRVDIVQTHSYRTTAIVWLLRRGGGVRLPWIAFQHGATAQDRKVRFYHWLDRRLAPAADQIVLMAAGLREGWRRHARKVRVIYNAVVPLHGKSVEGGSAPIGGVRPVYGVVGRLSHEKGLDLFLQSCALLRQRGRVFSAVIVGDGPEHDRLKALNDELGLGTVVSFVPATAEVGSIYRALDALVIPSRSEGLPNVLLEALAQDVPVVSTAVGAVTEVLSDPAAGLVVPPGDPAVLADAMERVLEVGRTPAAREARRRCVERHSLAARTAAHLTLYRELTGGRWIPVEV